MSFVFLCVFLTRWFKELAQKSFTGLEESFDFLNYFVYFAIKR
jgi:hypothetical protein